MDGLDSDPRLSCDPYITSNCTHFLPNLVQPYTQFSISQNTSFLSQWLTRKLSFTHMHTRTQRQLRMFLVCWLAEKGWEWEIIELEWTKINLLSESLHSLSEEKKSIRPLVPWKQTHFFPTRTTRPSLHIQVRWELRTFGSEEYKPCSSDGALQGSDDKYV